MNTQTKLVTALAVVVVIAIGSTGYAARKGAAGEGKGAARGKIVREFAALGLTTEQKAQVKEILKNHRPTVQPLAKQYVTERRALRDLIHAESMDEAAIRAQVEKVAKVDADLAVERAHVSHDVRAVLTPDQIQKLKELKSDRDARVGERRARVAKRHAED